MIRGQFPRFSFAGRTLKYEPGQASLYDPDTLYIAFPVEGVMYEHSCRVEGIDSIENKIKKTDLQTLGIEQRAALFKRREEAITFTENLLNTYPFTIHTAGSDKYGRILSRVVFHLPGGRDLDLAQTLITRKLVFPYSGETKMTLVQQADFCLTNPSDCTPALVV